MKKNLICAMLSVLLFALGALPAWSQTVSAQVEGTVTESGKPLPNVKVVLTNKGTGKVFNLKTDKSGKFTAVGVPYGSYEVEVISSSGAPSDRGSSISDPSAFTRACEAISYAAARAS